MNYTNNGVNVQGTDYRYLDSVIAEFYGQDLVDNGYLVLASALPGFRQTGQDRLVVEPHTYHFNGIEKTHNSTVRYIEGEQRLSDGFQMVCSCGYAQTYC